jgi:hypothetical protein
MDQNWILKIYILHQVTIFNWRDFFRMQFLFRNKKHTVFMAILSFLGTKSDKSFQKAEM